jgi:hypothetical protein
MAPAALIWLYHNHDLDRKQAFWNGLLQVRAPPRGRSGENSSGGLDARWIGTWPAYRFWLRLITALIGDDSSIRHRNIALAALPES